MAQTREIAAPQELSPDASSYPRATKRQPNQNEKDDLFLFVVNAAEMTAAGLNILVAKSVRLGMPSQIDPVSEDLRDSLAHLHLAKLDVESLGKTVQDLHADRRRMGEMLVAIRLIPDDQFSSVVEELESAITSATSDASSLYLVLTAQEMAAQMQCSVPVIYQRESADEFFSALAPGRKNGKRFPAFLLNDKLDRSLMKRVIQAYKEASVGTTLMWSFLRAPQNEFGGLTAVQMLLGGSAPAYANMSRDERAEAIMDVVDEELSRVR
jgi:hypothetical protein